MSTRQRFGATALVLLSLSRAAVAQDAASRASEASLAALGAVPVAAVELLGAGGRFSVAAVHPLGHSVQVVLVSGVEGARFSVDIGAEVLRSTAIAAGDVVMVTAVSGGFLLSVGAAALVFVPSAAAAALIHHRELGS